MSIKGNSGTIVFALVVTTLSAALLAAAATILKPAQDENVLKEKQQNILSLVGLNDPTITKNSTNWFRVWSLTKKVKRYKGWRLLLWIWPWRKN